MKISIISLLLNSPIKFDTIWHVPRRINHRLLGHYHNWQFTISHDQEVVHRTPPDRGGRHGNDMLGVKWIYRLQIVGICLRNDPTDNNILATIYHHPKTEREDTALQTHNSRGKDQRIGDLVLLKAHLGKCMRWLNVHCSVLFACSSSNWLVGNGGSMGHKLEIDTNNNNNNININTNKSVTNGQCVTIGVVDAGHWPEL